MIASDCLRWLLNVAISRNLDLPIQLLFGGLVQAMKEVRESSSLSQLIAGCVRCCLWCFEKSMEFVNGYAYVFVCSENVGFCAGCARTHSLITAHPKQVIVADCR